MPEKLSAVEVLSRLVERVRQIEKQAAQVASVMERMIVAAERQRAAAPPLFISGEDAKV